MDQIYNKQIRNYIKTGELPSISGEKLANGILHFHGDITLEKLENLHKNGLLKKEELQHVLSNIRRIYIWYVKPGITDLSQMHKLEKLSIFVEHKSSKFVLPKKLKELSIRGESGKIRNRLPRAKVKIEGKIDYLNYFSLSYVKLEKFDCPPTLKIESLFLTNVMFRLETKEIRDQVLLEEFKEDVLKSKNFKTNFNKKLNSLISKFRNLNKSSIGEYRTKYIIQEEYDNCALALKPWYDMLDDICISNGYNGCSPNWEELRTEAIDGSEENIKWHFVELFFQFRDYFFLKELKEVDIERYLTLLDTEIKQFKIKSHNIKLCDGKCQKLDSDYYISLSIISRKFFRNKDTLFRVCSCITSEKMYQLFESNIDRPIFIEYLKTLKKNWEEKRKNPLSEAPIYKDEILKMFSQKISVLTLKDMNFNDSSLCKFIENCGANYVNIEQNKFSRTETLEYILERISENVSNLNTDWPCSDVRKIYMRLLQKNKYIHIPKIIGSRNGERYETSSWKTY